MQAEMKQFKTWSCSPVHTSRNGPYSKAIKAETFDDHVSLSKTFLGFVHKHHAVPLNQLSLIHHLDGFFLASFISFCKQREKSRAGPMQQLTLAKKIAYYFSKQFPQLTLPHNCPHEELAEWLITMESQIKSVMPPPPPKVPPPQTGLNSWVEGVVTTAMQAHHQECVVK